MSAPHPDPPLKGRGFKFFQESGNQFETTSILAALNTIRTQPVSHSTTIIQLDFTFPSQVRSLLNRGQVSMVTFRLHSRFKLRDCLLQTTDIALQIRLYGVLIPL